jgi:hypothetical protein
VLRRLRGAVGFVISNGYRGDGLLPNFPPVISRVRRDDAGRTFGKSSCAIATAEGVIARERSRGLEILDRRDWR